MTIALLAACADSTTPEPVGGETHFLASCSEGACGLGLECVCGVCTQPCTTDNTCKDLSELATCEAAGTPNGACDNPQANPVCDVKCMSDDECDPLGNGYTCEQGSCRKLGPGACVRDGEIYADGASYMLDCNTCTCGDGNVICTRLACSDGGVDGSTDATIDHVDAGDGGDPLACTVGAITYPNGSIDLPDPSSCNACMCIDGLVGTCDEDVCPLPTCHPLHAISWYTVGPFDRPDLIVHHELARNGELTRTNWFQEACNTTLPACGGNGIDAADLNAALLDPDVVAALAAAPVSYGTPAADGGGAFSVEGRAVSLDDGCMSDDCGVPAGVRALYQLLQRLAPQQHCEPMVPIVCLDGSDAIHDGNVMLIDVVDAAGLRGIRHVTGDIEAPLDASILDQLECLERVDGSLILRGGTSDRARGLQRLTTVGKTLWIENTLLTDLEDFAQVEGAEVLALHWNSLLSDISALSDLMITRGYSILVCPELTSIDALGGHTSLPLGITLLSNPKLASLAGLTGLVTMGSLVIGQNERLTSLAGLETLTSVALLQLDGNPNLSDISALEGITLEGMLPVESLETANRITIYNNPNLDLCEVTRVASHAGTDCTCPPTSTGVCACSSTCNCTGNDNASMCTP